ncbi:MAG TPA: lytic transglycosylase domain-containing protein [Pseudolysinimonas sp.]|jgi:membrane-bound lytic murein transglycosylase B|nr:lytic transglycosylase domain-containing protein [Pseudolysinimonas sp.]
MRWAAIIGGALGLFVVGALVLVLFAPIPTVPPSAPQPAQSAPTWAAAGPAPRAAADPGAGIQTWADADWAAQMAAATGIPVRALVAYAGAAMVKAEQMPECGLSWTTLAGVGAVESDHGRFGGSSLDAGGTAVPGIFGIALDGVTTAHVPDSDDGAIDGDPDADRAVGPMQLIPQTWRNWHVDGGADGVEDPQNIDDAATAAANYLCRSSIDMDTEQGWRAAISAYNSSNEYLAKVAATATAYNAASAAVE